MNTLGWATHWRIARRDLHVGFRGLRLLFICLFLGVATLAAIGSLTAAVTAELASRGQTLLGGDLEVAMTQPRPASGKAALRRLGENGETSASRDGAAQRRQIGRRRDDELKGVDSLSLYARDAGAGIMPPCLRTGKMASARQQDGLGQATRSATAPPPAP